MRHAGIGVMAAYEFRRAQEARYRLNPGLGRQPLKRAYGEEPESWRQTAFVLSKAGLKLALPVMLLLVLLGAAFVFADAFFSLNGMPVLIRNAGLAINDLVLPGAWSLIHLTNRRLGPAHAFAHLMAALAIGLALILINPGHMDEWAPAMTSRALLSFGGAFLVANFVAITFFDGARGPSWWTAPLAGSFAASLVFSLIYYPAAFAGERWTDFALVHCAVFLGMSVLLLAPYWLLRPAMRPLGGRNGY
jgi:uncharacterized PurR-regulated membrane protein YhhQ (DUF165 family)